MPEESIVDQLLNALGIEEERLGELMKQIDRMVINCGGAHFLIEKWTELYELAETPEEAFLVGHMATLLADSLAYVENPLAFMVASVEAVQHLQERCSQEVTKN